MPQDRLVALHACLRNPALVSPHADGHQACRRFDGRGPVVDAPQPHLRAVAFKADVDLAAAPPSGSQIRAGRAPTSIASQATDRPARRMKPTGAAAPATRSDGPCPISGRGFCTVRRAACRIRQV